MNMDLKMSICENCKKEFSLTDQDFGLLEKMHMPAPHFCAHCSMIDRMPWRNERTLYKRPNNASGITGDIISIYSPESGIVVYDNKSWWGDGWDIATFAKEYDFSRPFFVQFKELLQTIPFPALQNWNCVNSDFCNCTSDSKNCYMVFGGDFSEDSLYSMYNLHCKGVCDSYWIENSEFCYELIVAERCHRVSYGMYVRDCLDSYFLYDCVNCINCLGCVGLRSKSYCILNVQYDKQEYMQIVNDLRLDTHEGREAFRNEFEHLKRSVPRRFAYLIKNQNVTGDRITNAKDCDHCFDIVGPAENLKDCYNAGWDSKDMLRVSQAGFGSELLYNSFGVFSSAQRISCSAYAPSSIGVTYCYNCPNGTNLFGCVGVKKGNYMILNKQYTKQEYNELVPKIIAHMDEMPYIDAKGRRYGYGDFFPGELSMFVYNESVSQDLETLVEKEIVERGSLYREKPRQKYPITTACEYIPNELPAQFETIKAEIFECTNKGEKVYCAGAFRITAEEYAFYERMHIPLPRYCFNCRHYVRFDQVRSMTLRSMQCDCRGATSASGEYVNTGTHDHGGESCQVRFETAFELNAPVTLYCETCYQREVN